MTTPERLVTRIALDGEAHAGDRWQVSISAVLALETADGRRVTLLDDRGWSTSGPVDMWTWTTPADLADTARTVVGPDEPIHGESYEGMAASHWGALASVAGAQGIAVTPDVLVALPHDVEMAPEIRERLHGRAAEGS
ncbi:hypothetical protein [Cellulomonas triticagri]|uniref:Uncharacterized protein n=1 Tax=Cellulomonas triticagri TaxID=2483352 RepID=A0A3M2JUT7_9CELL|nr:hypothetical protein [Cellulomonas triticagri]RMI13868.1 hypothetical protein EBM89_02540 [Cellulomonas triticagri]